MSIGHLFVGMITATAVFTVPFIAIWHYGSKFYHEANQQGHLPFLSALFGMTVGLFTSTAIVGVWLSIVSFVGFPARYYACVFSYGNVQECRNLYGENSEMAKDFEQSLERSEENLPREDRQDVPPWLKLY